MSWIVDFFTGPDTPAPRNLYQETADTLQAQVNLAPQIYETRAKYDPLYAALTSQEAQDVLLGTPTQRGWLSVLEQDVMPAESRMAAAATQAQRAGDISAVETLGPRAVAAWMAANPEQAALLDRLNASMSEDLAGGGALSPYEQRLMQQSIRSGQAERGMGYGPTDLYEEALTRALTTRSRKAALRDQAMRLAGVNASTTLDPFMAILGRPSTVTPVTASQLYGQSNSDLSRANPQQFDPFSAYASDLYNTNYNAQAAADIAAFNMGGTITSAILGAGGKAAGAACWVAREVFGEHDPRWQLFRAWLLSRAPTWFRRLYLRYGQRFAAWVHDKPRLKAVVRRWMERRIGRGQAKWRLKIGGFYAVQSRNHL